MDDLLDALKNSRVFNALDEEERRRLLPKFTPVKLSDGNILFYQGDVSDSVYLLVSGKLSAEVLTVSDESRIVGHIEAGETVGEMGAMSGEPRSLTVRALRDAELLRLSANDFMAICHRNPRVLFAALSPIVTRTNSIIQMLSSERVNKRIIVLPASKDIVLKDFAESLTKHTHHLKNTLVISDYQEEFKDKNIHFSEVSENIKKLGQNKKKIRHYIYILSAYDTPLARASFKHADVVYVVAKADSTPHIDHEVLDKIASRHSHLHVPPALVLLHPEGTPAAKDTIKWLALTEFSFHHHVRMDTARDFQRLLRFMRGRAFGLVLSGGGTRGWAHLGVIKALRNAKIPIDMIGGTSAGAIAGACYAVNQSFDDAYDRFYKIVVRSRHSISWRSLTWPNISLFNAKNFTMAQKEAFDEIRIEDLWMPFFCTSCNLANNREEIHRSGLLWEKLRASSSLPGIIPPMIIDGEMHFDGGLMNNLPVDIMRKFVGTSGKVIAAELNTFHRMNTKFNFPPVLTFTESVMARLGLGTNKYKFPPFIDTFVRALFVGSEFRARQSGLVANIYINLELGEYSVLHSNPEQSDELINVGYKAAMKQIHDKDK